MYDSKFVVAIKANGKILRENKDLVHLPFGSEFSVLVKNLNSRRAKFTLHIDGQDVLDGENIIVDANNEIEMKRFIRNGNMNEGNAFKFIERTQKIEDGPRGIKIDDGVVRVEFWFEQEVPKVTTTYHRDVWWDDYYRTFPAYFWRDYHGRPVYGSMISDHNDISNVKLGSANVTRGMSSAASNSVHSTNATFSANIASPDMVQSYNSPTSAEATVVNDVGITVPGSRVEQKFQTVYGFNSEIQSNVIIIRLTGKVGTINIVVPVTVKSKQKCGTCNHTNKSNAKFCSECGAGLELL